MFFNLREFYLLIVLCSLTVGYQLMFYFFIQYNKRRKNKLKHDRILISYGLMASFTEIAYLIQSINRFFFSSGQYDEIAFKLAGLALYLGIITYLIFASEAFPQIISTIALRLLLFTLILAVIVSIFFEIIPIIFLYMIIAGVLGCSGILFIQVRLMKLTRGGVRKALIMYTIGLTLSLYGGILTAISFLNQLESPFFFAGTLMVLVGTMINFIGVYNFPTFLEFQWRENLRGLYIFERTNLRILFSFNFSEFIDQERDYYDEPAKALYSHGLTGIHDIIDDLTETKGETIHKIAQGDHYFLLEHGEGLISRVSFALLVKKDMESYNFFLNEIKKSFQNSYQNILKNLDILDGNEERLFINFNKDIIRLLE